MPSNVIVGLQWGDEGKGKITDFLSKNSDYVIRYQGGNNSGHSIHIENNYFILHLIPSGIVYPNVKCIIGPGMVVDPKFLIKELINLKSMGINVDNIFIAKRSHIIMPYHILLDKYKEEYLGKNFIGTTNKGIGPAYEDKISRIGIRMLDFFYPDIFYKKLKNNIELKNIIFKKIYKKPTISVEIIYKKYMEYAKILSSRIIDAVYEIHIALNKNKRILFEGAQAMLLDIDYGTYPFVTTSSSTTGGVCVGSGIPPVGFDNFFGVIKSYCTRVGNGPFPTEIIKTKLVNYLRNKGNEYGSTTKRPRRCGWLDLVAIKYSCKINGINYLIMTKLDVLNGLNYIKICIKYEIDGLEVNYFTPDIGNNKINCIYKKFKGWNQNICDIKEYENLPINCKKYINFIEEYIGLKIILISIGSERNKNIIKYKHLFYKIFSSEKI
ncbi:adenylosuccinate synthase [Blattabacterium cuenoti]|uniref:adenylosuccinate synthase n=1 Tax=Blattabacterium cuenoti TaxID=1653831 RepID=UPI00163D2803|nr:adenylosuccinate synthase [Blattabacterium cuenoti]